MYECSLKMKTVIGPILFDDMHKVSAITSANDAGLSAGYAATYANSI